MEAKMIFNELRDVPARHDKDVVLDRQLTVLETRVDTTLTMLPNKADLSELKAELKADIHGESTHLSKWMAATAITMLIGFGLGFGGMILTMMSRLHGA
ncbi:hypothetical protein [Massilia sp. CT11-137]|uniref:hypothetical protein n=1 Tax=Massilia sp. CT11-137 TaxID=3393901 RepID=UPI0039A45C03